MAGYLHEAQALRALPEAPSVDATLLELHAYLLDVRRRQDRAEELLRLAIRLRGAVRRRSAGVADTAGDAWDRAAVRLRAAPVQSGDGFSSAKERAAEANLAVLDLRLAARTAATLVDLCDDAVEVIRIVYRGLDSVRFDVGQLLRTYLVESNLER